MDPPAQGAGEAAKGGTGGAAVGSERGAEEARGGEGGKRGVEEGVGAGEGAEGGRLIWVDFSVGALTRTRNVPALAARVYV